MTMKIFFRSPDMAKKALWLGLSLLSLAALFGKKNVLLILQHPNVCPIFPIKMAGTAVTVPTPLPWAKSAPSGFLAIHLWQVKQVEKTGLIWTWSWEQH